MRIKFQVNTDAEEEAYVLGSEWDQAKAKEAGLRMKSARMRSLGLFVVGDCAELGNWCVEKAVRLSQHVEGSDDDKRQKKSNVWSTTVDIDDLSVEKIEYRYFIGHVVNGLCDSVHSWEANPYPRILRACDEKAPGVATYGRYGGSSCVEAGWLGSQQSEVQLRIHGSDALTLYDDDSDVYPREYYIKCLPIDLRRRPRRSGNQQQQHNRPATTDATNSSQPVTVLNFSQPGESESTMRHMDSGVFLSDMGKELSGRGIPQGMMASMNASADDITEYMTSDVQVSILRNAKRIQLNDPPPNVNHPYPQPIEGVPYTPGDFVTFRLRTRKPAEIGFKITICTVECTDRDDDLTHSKTGMILGTAVVARCPAEKSKQFSECIINSRDLEPVGMLKVDVLVIRPAHCVNNRTGLRLARPCTSPAPSPRRLSPVSGQSTPTPQSTINRSLVIGHRGMGSTFSHHGVPSAKVTENTIASFERAINHGADMIEFDVMLTKDMVPVIYHDFVTFVKATSKSNDSKSCRIHMEKCVSKTDGEKITPIRIPIQDLTLDELLSLDVESAAEKNYRIGTSAKATDEGNEHEKYRHDSGISIESGKNAHSSAHFTPISAEKASSNQENLEYCEIKVPIVIDKDANADNVSLCSEEVATVMSGMLISETRKEEAYDSDRSIDSGFDVEPTKRFANKENVSNVPINAVISTNESNSKSAPQQAPTSRSPCRFERPFPTLRECFTSLDPKCGFNVEVKSSMQLAHGAFEEDFRSSVELNDYVDAILAVVYEHASEDGRPIVFSSFDPDICVMLRLKQNLYPVLFLSQGAHPDYPPFADSRTQSVADAVQFARSENILGVDLYSKELLNDLGMVRHVKSSALSVYCWGSDNNNHQNMKKLEEAGVDAIILDRCDEFIS